VSCSHSPNCYSFMQNKFYCVSCQLHPRLLHKISAVTKKIFIMPIGTFLPKLASFPFTCFVHKHNFLKI